MKSYKVEFIEQQMFVFDVQAENEEQAKEKGYDLLSESINNGTTHYFENGDRDIEHNYTYDVTGTDDDAFLPSTGGGFKEGLCVNCGEDITGNRNGQCPFCFNKK